MGFLPPRPEKVEDVLGEGEGTLRHACRFTEQRVLLLHLLNTPRRVIGPKQNGCVSVRWDHRVFNGLALCVAQSSKAIDEVSH